MNSRTNEQIETVINIKEFLWDLLEQWKAVLITALVVMLMVAGAKYAKDMKAYEAARTAKEAEKKAAQENIPMEDRIADILSGLPESERSVVMTLVNQNELIEAQMEYVNNSIILNSDPTNQRTLVVDYYVSAAEDSDSVRASLLFGYKALLNNKDVVKRVGETIDPEAEYSYIEELFYIENSEKEASDQRDDAVMEIRIVLPEKADSTKVEEALTAELQDFSSTLSSKIGAHRLSLLDVKETYIYNKAAVDLRTNTLYSINNLLNNSKNAQSSLSDGQKAAIEAITAIKASEKTAANTDEETETKAAEAEAAKPGFSRKYALLGFVLGVMMYAFIYLLIVIRRGCLVCAGDASRYTDSRLLGELYKQTEAAGIKKLFKSRFVQKYRYGSRLDTLKQAEKMSASVEAVCRREGIKELTIFDLSGSDKLKDSIVNEIKKLGIKVSEIPAGEDINENDLCSVADAVLLTGNTTKVSALCGLTGLMKDYDIKLLGSVYAARL